MGWATFIGETMPKESKIDPKQFEQLCIQQISEKEIAEYFGVDRTTITRFCKKTYGATFASFLQQKRMMGKALLVNKALKLAERNGAVMIFMLKNWCGMKDTPDTDDKSNGVTADMEKWFNNVKGNADDGTDTKAT